MTNQEYDPVTEAVDESFPASDPPSWTATGVGNPHTADEQVQEETPAYGGGDKLLHAISRLEDLLAAGKPGAEAAWFGRAAAELPEIVDCLRKHRDAAEGPNGLYANDDLTRPSLLRVVDKLKQEHHELKEQADSLAQRIARSCGGAQEELALRYVQLREQVESLLLALRRHEADEEDINVDTYNMDFGAGD